MNAEAQRGFTLPEVLVALMVFAVIATASVYALRLGVDSRDQLAVADDKLKAFQLARSLIKEDLAQVSDRTVRDEYGEIQIAPFRGNLVSYGARVDDDEKLLMAFVRQGWRNPEADAPRSTFQYVEYVFRGGEIIRRARAYLDEAPQADVFERVIFSGLDDARASFLIGEARGELDWAEIWPVSGRLSPPAAVSFTLTWTEGSAEEHRFWIGDVGRVQ